MQQACQALPVAKVYVDVKTIRCSVADGRGAPMAAAGGRGYTGAVSEFETCLRVMRELKTADASGRRLLLLEIQPFLTLGSAGSGDDHFDGLSVDRDERKTVVRVRRSARLIMGAVAFSVASLITRGLLAADGADAHLVVVRVIVVFWAVVCWFWFYTVLRMNQRIELDRVTGAVSLCEGSSPPFLVALPEHIDGVFIERPCGKGPTLGLRLKTGRCLYLCDSGTEETLSRLAKDIRAHLGSGDGSGGAAQGKSGGAAPPICRLCRGAVAAQDINRVSGFAACPRCRVLFSIQTPAPTVSAEPAAPVVFPGHLRLDAAGRELSVSFAWRRNPFAYILAIFAPIANYLVWVSLASAIQDGALFMLPFLAVFVLAAATLAYWALVLLLNRTVLRARPGELEIRHGPFPWWTIRRLVAREIDQLYCFKRREASGPYGVYCLSALLADGTRVPLASGEAALFVEHVQELERRFESFLGIADRALPEELPKVAKAQAP